MRGEIGGEGVGLAEQPQGLVDQMRTEVVEQAGALGRIVPSSPAGIAGRKRSQCISHSISSPRRPDLDQLAHGQIVAVPSAIVEGGKHAFPFAGERDQGVGFGHGDGEGLVDDDMLAGLERRPGEREMLVVRRRDDDELDGRIGDQRQRIAHGRDSVRHVAAGGDRLQGQAVAGLDERRVEDGAAKAVADQAGRDGQPRPPGLIIRRRDSGEAPRRRRSGRVRAPRPAWSGP